MTSEAGVRTEIGTSGMRRPRWSVALAWVALVAALPLAWWLWPAHPDIIALDPASGTRNLGRLVELAINVLWIPAGLVVHLRRPDQRLGALMMLLGWVGLSFGLIYGARDPLLFTAGILVFPVRWPLFSYVVLAYPDGRLHSRVERAVVVAGVAFAVVYGWMRLPIWDPAIYGWEGLNLLLVRDLPGLHALFFDNLVDAYDIGLNATLVVLFARRLLRARGAALRVTAPVAAPMVVQALSYGTFALFALQQRLWNPAGYDWQASPVSGLLIQVKDFAILLVPLGVLVGLEVARRRRARLSDLMVQLGAGADDQPLQATLRRVLGDPTLRVGYAVDDGERFLDEEGLEVELPDPSDASCVVTDLRGDGRRLGVVVHDRALLTDPQLLHAVAAATRLAVASRRWQAEVEARTADARATATAAADAAEAERRRIGRNLHDGAQQRLANLAVLLGLAESSLDSPEAVARLRVLREEVDAAIGDVRDLARGLAPPLLAREGLGAALRALAARSPLVEVAAAPDGRLPEPVESAAYFVASEAVANALKHAGPTRVQVAATVAGGALDVAVTDDGRGGADPNSPGLAGLRDRVTALGGQLSVVSAPDAGTTVRARIPMPTFADAQP